MKPGRAMVLLSHILMTTDLSEYSLAAMDHVASLKLLYAARVTLLHVVDHRSASAEGDAQKALGEFAARYINPALRAVPLIRAGNPAEEIARFAKDHAVDMVIMATHGRTGLSHILMGSVAEKTVRLSPAPVLTVKPRPLRDVMLRSEDVERELHLR